MKYKPGDDPAASYTQVQQGSVRLGDTQITFYTKPGLPSRSLYEPSTELFIKQAVINPSDAVLLYGCDLGAITSYLAIRYPQAKLYITSHNYTCLEMSRMALAANEVHSVEILSGVDLPREQNGKLNVIFIQLPKGRLLARRWLTQAYHALVIGGSLYLAGSNQAGIQSVIKDGHELFGNSRVLGYKKGNRIAQFTRMDEESQLPSWVNHPGIAAGTWVEFEVSLRGHNFAIHSLPGVFSFDRLDAGTRMLLEVIKIPPNACVLDVGCGYGIIGLFAAAEGARTVHLVDIDHLAVASSEETLKINGIDQATVFAGDLLQTTPDNHYDLILSNPPFHTGHAVDYQVAAELIRQSNQKLLTGGQLIIVANRFLRYEHLISSIFGNVTLLAESGKFHVLSGLKSR